MRRRSEVSARLCRWLLGLAALGLAGLIAVLALAGRWLDVKPGVVAPADVAVVLAGSFDRTLHAADLYRERLVSRVAVSRPAAEPVHLRLAAVGIPVTPEEETHRRILVHLGVPDSAIDLLPGRSGSTRDEADALARYVEGRDVRLVVVTSPFHVRRATMLLGRRLPGLPLQVVATPYEEFDWRWWRSPDSARAVLLETAKLVYMLVRGSYNTLSDKATNSSAPDAGRQRTAP